jgi:hypothetical protein
MYQNTDITDTLVGLVEDNALIASGDFASFFGAPIASTAEVPSILTITYRDIPPVAGIPSAGAGFGDVPASAKTSSTAADSGQLPGRLCAAGQAIIDAQALRATLASMDAGPLLQTPADQDSQVSFLPTLPQLLLSPPPHFLEKNNMQCMIFPRNFML